MNWIFDEADGSQSMLISFEDFPPTVGIGGEGLRRHIGDAVAYLEGEGLLVVHRSLEGVRSVQLSHEGIVEIEQARTRPEQPTEHFVPIINITHVNTMIASQIQQGSPGATQSGEFSVGERDKIHTFIQNARDAAQHPDLEPEDRFKVTAELDFMVKELSRPEPRATRSEAAGMLVRAVILGGLGGSLGDGITALPWHSVLQGFGN
jgi:hypothetical protein